MTQDSTRAERVPAPIRVFPDLFGFRIVVEYGRVAIDYDQLESLISQLVQLQAKRDSITIDSFLDRSDSPDWLRELVKQRIAGE